jgi:hypothetical protein
MRRPRRHLRFRDYLAGRGLRLLPAKAVAAGILPFIAFDLIKVALAALVAVAPAIAPPRTCANLEKPAKGFVVASEYTVL